MVNIMTKTKLLATAFAVASLSFSAYAADEPKMEKCMVGKTEVMVPAGECDKVMKGDMGGLSDEVKAQVEAAKEAK